MNALRFLQLSTSGASLFLTTSDADLWPLWAKKKIAQEKKTI